jgi:hypothetical protein
MTLAKNCGKSKGKLRDEGELKDIVSWEII